MPSDDITRLYDFTPSTTIVSDQVDQELNLLVTTCNGKFGRSVDNTLSGSNTFTGAASFSSTVGFTTSIPTLPAATPTMTNEVTSKAYVDSRTFPTGALNIYVGTTAPTGWVLSAGGTIGNASSGATTRANADTSDLFTLLWNSLADGQAAVSGGRGVSAAADFAANKTIALPDLRGRIAVGKDDMGGSAANRITSASTNGANATTLGGVGGAQTHTLTVPEMPAHTHSIGTAITITAGAGGIAEATPGAVNSGSTGGGGAHSNTQPWIALNYIIKL